jgi:hypothetical protein
VIWPGGYEGTEVRWWPTILLVPILCWAQALEPPEALERYLAEQGYQQSGCSDSVFSTQIDASLPALKKHGAMTSFKRIIQPGQVVYRGLHFTDDNLVKTQVIARFLAHETNPPRPPGDISVTPLNYSFTFKEVADYNGSTAYVFLLKPHRKRARLFRGELWLDAETAAPLRMWGDLVKSPSIFIRSFRFVQDYQTVAGCASPLRLLLTARTRIAGPAEMTEWLHPASDTPEGTGTLNGVADFKNGVQAGQ